MFHPEGPTFWELARQALASTERGYDLLAPKFDLTPFRTPDAFLAAASPYLGSPGLDETIVPFDSGLGKDENGDVTDDEINHWAGAHFPFTSSRVAVRPVR